MSELDPRFVGRWTLANEEERRTAEFTADGVMHYVVDIGDRELTMELTWRVEGEMLVSEHASEGRTTHARFTFPHERTLVLDYGNETFTFEKA